MILCNGEVTDVQQQVAVTREYYKHVCVFIQHRPGHLSMYWESTVKPACTSFMITQKQDQFCGNRVPPVTKTSLPAIIPQSCTNK